MHAAEDEDDGTDLEAEDLYEFAGIGYCVGDAEGVDGIAYIDEIEADDQQIIDCLGQIEIAMEDIDEEDLAILEESAGDPNGQDDAEDEIECVGKENVRHDD